MFGRKNKGGYNRGKRVVIARARLYNVEQARIERRLMWENLIMVLVLLVLLVLIFCVLLSNGTLARMVQYVIR